MRTAASLTLAVLTVLPLPGEPVNADSAIVRDFEKGVANYVQLRKAEESKLPRLRATGSPEKIDQHQHRLAEAIIMARKDARQGDIFTPSIDKEFRRLMGLALQPAEAARIRKSLRDSEPAAWQPQVNRPYPSDVPVQSTPPSILLNLPKLSPDMEYRFVSRTLILLDTKANLIIDFMSNVGP